MTMMHNRLLVPVLLVALLLSISSAAVAGKSSKSRRASTDAALLLPIRNARIPMAGVLSGGQPTQEQVEIAARAGFRTVVNLRTDAETGFEWEQAVVEDLGMRYVQIPVAGGKGLTREIIERIDDALDSAIKNGPVLLHCASGNRIGAVLALRAAWLEELAAEAAISYGLASGMTSLEPLTRELLGLPEID